MNVRLFVNVDSDNDAFQNGNAVPELQRILRRIVQRLDVSGGEVIKDVNGNTVGEWGLMTEDEDDENESLFDREFSYPVEDFEL